MFKGQLFEREKGDKTGIPDGLEKPDSNPLTNMGEINGEVATEERGLAREADVWFREN